MTPEEARQILNGRQPGDRAQAQQVWDQAYPGQPYQLIGGDAERIKPSTEFGLGSTGGYGGPQAGTPVESATPLPGDEPPPPPPPPGDEPPPGGGGGYQPPPDTEYHRPLPETGFGGAGSLAEMAAQNRQAARTWGQGLDETFRDTANMYQGQEAGFRAQAVGGPGGYGDILAGRGGFTEDQRRNLLQEEMLSSGMATPDQLNELYLTPGEQGGIAGSPFAARDIAAGQLQGLEGIQKTGEARQREALASGEGMYESAVEGMAGQLGVDPGYRQGMQGIIGDTAAGYKEIIDPNYLGLSSGYWGGMQGDIGDMRAGYRETIDPKYLALSDEFTNRYDVGERDFQNIRDVAGRRAGLLGQSRQEEIERSAAAAGNTSPLALAAAKNRAGYYGDMASADSAVQADIEARRLGLNTTMGRETMRLGAERDISGRATGAVENLAGMSERARRDYENMRLGSERDIANRATGALQHLSGMSESTARDYEDMRMGAARDVSNRMMERANVAGGRRLGAEQDISAAQQDLGRYQTGTIIGQTQYGESEAQRRSQDLATQRQQATGQGIDTRFEQGYGASGALAGRYGGVFGQQKAEEAEGRGFLTGQQAAAQEGGLTSAQQRIGAGAVQLAGINDPLQTILGLKTTPSTWERLVGTGIQAGGSIAGGALGAAP